MSKILIAGGAGFIGSNLYDELNKQKFHKIKIVDNLSTGSKTNLSDKALEDFINLDIDTCPQNVLNDLCAGVDYVFQMAALPNVQYSMENPIGTMGSNLISTIKILEACRTNKVKRLIYSGSCSCYGNAKNIPTNEKEKINPLSPYALNKYQGEEYCNLYSAIYNIDTIVLRYFNVYGPRMTTTGAYRSVLSVFLEAYNNKKPFNIVNDGKQRRDFVHVFDVVAANIKAMNNKTSVNEAINIGCGKNYSVNEIADMFGAEKVYGEKRIEPKETLADISKAKNTLNWKPEVELKNWIKEQL